MAGTNQLAITLRPGRGPTSERAKHSAEENQATIYDAFKGFRSAASPLTTESFSHGRQPQPAHLANNKLLEVSGLKFLENYADCPFRLQRLLDWRHGDDLFIRAGALVKDGLTT